MGVGACSAFKTVQVVRVLVCHVSFQSSGSTRFAGSHCVSNRRRQSAWYSRSQRKPASDVRSPEPMPAAADSRAVGMD